MGSGVAGRDGLITRGPWDSQGGTEPEEYPGACLAVSELTDLKDQQAPFPASRLGAHQFEWRFAQARGQH